VEDELASPHRGHHPLEASELALHDLDVAAKMEEVPPVSGGEVVDHPHVVPLGEERIYEVGADEARPAGDETPSH
jgi:hypothetical protein